MKNLQWFKIEEKGYPLRPYGYPIEYREEKQYIPCWVWKEGGFDCFATTYSYKNAEREDGFMCENASLITHWAYIDTGFPI